MKDDLVKMMQTICTLDPAIDQARSNVTKFAETRDPKHLVIRDGAVPTLYNLRPIGTSMMTGWVDATPVYTEKYRRAFQVAVDSIQNVPHEDGPLVDPVMLPSMPMRVGGVEVTVWHEEMFSPLAARLDLTSIYEIGHIAYERAFLGKALARGAVSWSLPPSSRAALDRMTAHRAEQSRSDALTTSAEASPKSTGRKSASSSAAPGSATAAPSDGATSPPA